MEDTILFFSILPSPFCPSTRLKEQKPTQRKKPPDDGQVDSIPLSNLQITNKTCKTSNKTSTTNNNKEKDNKNNNKEKDNKTTQDPPPLSFSPFTQFKVDSKVWEANLRHLASLNRCAKSHTSDVHKAGEWIADRLREIPKLEVETQDVTVKEQFQSVNVIGTLKGTKYADIWYVIGAHYDSTSENIKLAAPGALDNASGTAAVIEMARIFSENSFPFTIKFILFTGEEQGYFGSKKYVQSMFIKDEIHQIKLMLNMDMISLDNIVIVETRETSLAETWEQLAHVNSIIPNVSFDIWGSDHVTFANAGVPSILTCSDHSKYPHYHRTTDLPDNLDVLAGHNTITMNVQAIYRCMELYSESMYE